MKVAKQKESRTSILDRWWGIKRRRKSEGGFLLVNRVNLL